MINDYLVQWRTANHDNVATQVTHYKTNSFAIQNQASHVTNRTYRLLSVNHACHRPPSVAYLFLVRNRTLWRDGHVCRAFCQKSRRNRRGNNEDATHDLEQIA